MMVFVDENIPNAVVSQFSKNQVLWVSTSSISGYGTEDVELMKHLLEYSSKHHRRPILITRDRTITRRPWEIDSWKTAEICIVVLRGKGWQVSCEQLLVLLNLWWPRIEAELVKNSLLLHLEVTTSGIRAKG
jgi:hypothetical protein